MCTETWKFLVTAIFFPQRNVPRVLKRKKKTGGRAGSENDTLLSMTMTCDRLKFWNGPAWRSKIGPETLGRKNLKKKNSDKTIRHSRRGNLITWILKAPDSS